MCGIAGIAGLGSPDRGLIDSMLEVIRHRGPDDSGVFLTDGVGLGHRRLSIIDLSGGHQPISNRDQSTWMVFNGEIYNYEPLREELQAKGYRFATQSDSEVIVALYDEYAEACVDHLRGMFSFAIWDARKKRVFAARDHLGQKPFYYAQVGDQLIFCSEIKGLLAAQPSLAEMDPAALDQYLNLRIIAPPRSMFRNIRKLPPGHSLTFTAGDGVQIKRFWDLNYEPKITGSEHELVDQLEAEIIESLRLHLVSDVPVGAFLSGGLDSTLVVSMLRKHVTTDSIQTFSMGLPYKQFDEAPYAKMVAEKYTTTHREKIIRPSLTEALPDLVWHLDEPSDPLSVCSYLISEMASEHVKVVLGGDGGDELFGGYDRYYGNKYAGIYATVPASLRKYLIGPLLDLLPDGGWYKSKAHQIKWLHRLAELDGGDRYAASLGYFYFNHDQRSELYGSRMLDQFADMDPGAAIREPYQRAKAQDVIDRMLYADSQVRLPDHPVMILDRMTMAHSLEARSPLMDHKLAEFAARLPVNMKVRGRSLRYIQYKLCERYLPEAVLHRPKQGFSSALPYMLKDEYTHLYQNVLRDSHLARDGYLRQNSIDFYVSQHQAQRTDHGNRLWLLINSEVWYRMFMEGMNRADIAAQVTLAA